MKPTEFLELLWQERASAILRTNDQEVARNAMNAAVAGGFRIVEFTLSVPGVYELIREFSAKPGLVVGAGTVLTTAEARAAVASGAVFIVSPVTDEEVIAQSAALGVTAVPGTHTATEMLVAHRAGAQLQKLFPPGTGGPSYVQALLGPLPFLRIVPTSGVDETNVGDWISAGVFGVGFVKSLFDAEDLSARRFDVIEKKACSLLQASRDARRPEREWSFE